MPPTVRHLIFAFFCCLPVPGLLAQCATVDALREQLADSTTTAGAVIAAAHADCPTAADSLGPALYSRTLFYYGLDDLPGAIRHGELALEELSRADTTLQLGKMTYNLGLFHSAVGDHRGAVRYFRRAAETFPLIDHPQSQRRYRTARVDLGYAYGQIGDYQRSEETLRSVAREAEQDDDVLTVARAHHQLADQYLAQGQGAAAAGAVEVAIAGFETAGDAAAALTARVSKVGILRQQGEAERALSQTLRLLSAPERLGQRDRVRLLNLGLLLYLDLGRPEPAEVYFEHTLTYLNEKGNPDPELLAQVWDNGGEVALARGDYATATQRFTTALTQLTPGFRLTPETPVPTRGQLAASPRKLDLLIYLGDLARTHELAERPDDALAALLAADAVVDQLREGLGGEVSALEWGNEVLPLYEQGIRLSHRLEQPETAFYLFEKSRAVLLLRAVAEHNLRGSLPPEEARRLTLSEGALREAQSRLLTAEDADPEALIAARQELLDLRTALATDYPDAFPDASPDVVTLPAALEALRTAGFDRHVQYFWGSDRVYLLDLSPERQRTVDLGGTKEAATILGNTLGYFTDARAIENDPGGYRRAAHLAYLTFLAPAAAPPDAALLLTPDGPLSYLPFAALVTDTTAAEAYLLRRNATAYAQSATLFARADGSPEGRTLVFTPFTTPRPGVDQPALTFSAAEAAEVTGHYPGEHLDGAAATRASLRERAGAYGLLHLGTHAWATRAAEDPPRILTADDPLYLPDVYALQLPNSLVVLSACRSNVGPLARGEGVLGLGRAFRAAGASGVVAGLWSLNDRNTAGITTAFYRELAAGTAAPFALHRAQVAFLDRDDLPAYRRSPYQWAALTYYGSPVEIPAPRDWPWAWVVILLALATVTSWWAYAKQARS